MVYPVIFIGAGIVYGGGKVIWCYDFNEWILLITIDYPQDYLVPKLNLGTRKQMENTESQ